MTSTGNSSVVGHKRERAALPSDAGSGAPVLHGAQRARARPKRHWTAEEHLRFLQGLRQFGRGHWREIATYIGSRSTIQVSSHAQRFFRRLQQKKKVNRSVNDTVLAATEEPQPLPSQAALQLLAPATLSSQSSSDNFVVPPRALNWIGERPATLPVSAPLPPPPPPPLFPPLPASSIALDQATAHQRVFRAATMPPPPPPPFSFETDASSAIDALQWLMLWATATGVYRAP